MQKSSTHIDKIDDGSKTRRTAFLCASAVIPITGQGDAVSLWQRISNMISIPGRRFSGPGCENGFFLITGGLDIPWAFRQYLSGQLLQGRMHNLLPPALNLRSQNTIEKAHSHAHKSLSTW